MTLQETIEQIHPLSKEAMDRAKAHWDGIAKPLHSLGKLEDVLIQIAGITGKEEISIEKRALLTFCADNGVVEENVTQSGQEVTATVAENFLQEKATAAILCRGAHDETLVTLVQKAHGGDEANGQALAAPLAHLLADLGDGGNCLHDMFLL